MRVGEQDGEVERGGEDAGHDQHVPPAEDFAEPAAENVEEETDAAAGEQEHAGFAIVEALVGREPVGDVEVGRHERRRIEQPDDGEHDHLAPDVGRCAREELADGDAVELLDIDVVTFEQAGDGCAVAGAVRDADLLQMLEALGLADEQSSEDDGQDRQHAEQEDDAPAEMAEDEVDAGGEEDAERPAALDDGIEQAAPARGHLLVDDGDGDGELGEGEAGGERADQCELPVVLHEVGQAGEDRGEGEAKHPDQLATVTIHRRAHEDGEHELREIDDGAEQAHQRLRQVQVARDPRQGEHEQVEVVGGERPAGGRHDDQIGRVVGGLGVPEGVRPEVRHQRGRKRRM